MILIAIVTLDNVGSIVNKGRCLLFFPDQEYFTILHLMPFTSGKSCAASGN